MCFSTTDVVSFPDDGVVVNNDSTYHGVRSRITKPVFSQLNAAGDIFFVFCHDDSFLIFIFACENENYASYSK